MLSNAIAYLPRAAKAITAAVFALSGAYAGAVDGGVTASEWIVVVAAGLAAALAVWKVENKPAG